MNTFGQPFVYMMNIAKFGLDALYTKFSFELNEIRFVLIGYQRLEELHIIVIIIDIST